MGDFFFDPNDVAEDVGYVKQNYLVDPCKLCGLSKKNERFLPEGKGEKGILIVLSKPDELTFSETLTDVMAHCGFDIMEDCIVACIQQCDTDYIGDEKLRFCKSKLECLVQELQPKLIITLGLKPTKHFLDTTIVSGLNGAREYQIETCRGDVFPSRKYNCWIAPTYEMSFVADGQKFEDVFFDTFINAVKYLDIPLPKSLYNYGEDIYVPKDEDIIEVLESFTDVSDLVSFDYETNQKFPYNGNPKLLYMSITDTDEYAFVLPLYSENKKVYRALRNFLISKSPKLSHNMKFEELWTRYVLCVEVANWTWDTILSTHLVDERRNKKSLEYQVYLHTGDIYKNLVDRKNIAGAKLSKLIKYSSFDSRSPLIVQKAHEAYFKENGLEKTNKFWVKCNNTLADLEYRGVLIDTNNLKSFDDEVTGKLYDASTYLDSSDIVEEYKSKYGKKPNYKAAPDMQKLFFKMLGVEPVSYTEHATNPQPQVNDELFQHLIKDGGDLAVFAENIHLYKTLSTLKNTFLRALYTYMDDKGFLHPTFNLWIAETCRSSCDSPNLQNIPKRDKYMRKFRSLFIPRYDTFLEVDYKAAEVFTLAMLTHDEVLIQQLLDGTDMHRYWASQIYQKPESEITKDERSIAKNTFVFPYFYGSYYVSIARALGMPEEHIKRLEDMFWDMYSGVKHWQDNLVKQYDRTGVVKSPLGFMRRAPLSRNQIINTPIQGTAHHFLLDGLNRSNDRMKELLMTSMSVLQVHDSILFDVIEPEMMDVIDITNEGLSNKSKWKFTRVVTLQAEWSMGPNWLDMEELVA